MMYENKLVSSAPLSTFYKIGCMENTHKVVNLDLKVYFGK